MTNDFDFIKQKFDESGVNAPENLNERLVEEQLKNVEPLKVKKSKTKVIYGVSAAAVIAIVLVNALVITGIVGTLRGGTGRLTDIFKSKPNTSAVSVNLKSFSTRQEVKDELQGIFDRKSEYNEYLDYKYYNAFDGAFITEDSAESLNGSANGSSSGSSSGSSAIGSSGGSSSHNSTYTQELGVDEADNIKTDGDYIYYKSDEETIEVIKTNNGSTEFVSKITAPEAPIDSYSLFADFYIYNNKLIAIVESSGNGNQISSAAVYDITDKRNITLSDRFTQSGSYCSSRMIGGTLYLVSNCYAYNSDVIPFVYENKATADEAARKELLAGCIYSVQNPSDSNFSVVSCIDTDKPEENVKTKAILGSANEIYCNTENLYITAYEYEPVYYDNFVTKGLSRSLPDYGDSYEYTEIVKIKLNDELELAGSAKVEGRIDNQYSLDEKDGNLRVATTSWDYEKSADINNLYVLDSGLKELGKVTGFAENESIKAVRYIGNTAYVITYEQTDPLFVIDLSNPSNPTITGEVKISGFSTMLVPVDENTLLGIGYHTYDPELDGIGMEIQNGLKIVTFDVSDKNNPTIIDTKIFENCDSQVQYNPKALLVNFERGDYTIPLNYSYYNFNYDIYDYYYDNYEVETHSGVLNFRIDNGKINVVDNYISDKFGKNEACVWVDRCVYIGDYIYMAGVENVYNYHDYITGNANVIIDSVKYK